MGQDQYDDLDEFAMDWRRLALAAAIFFIGFVCGVVIS